MSFNFSDICKTANRFHAQGYSRSASFILAWRLAKETASVSVSGVKYGDRQQQLAQIAAVEPETVAVELQREAENAADQNAIAVYLNGRKAGYVPAAAARLIAGLMDAGQHIAARLTRIVGGWADGISYGARLALAM